MKYNKILFAILILSIGLTSCEKELAIKEDPIIIEGPSEEIEYPVAIGAVTDNNGALQNVEISLYQLGELIGKTTTNEDGNYNTTDIETLSGIDLILEFKKEEFDVIYRKRTEQVLKSNTIDVRMINEEDLIESSSYITNPNADEYITLSGYIINSESNPGFANIAVEYTLADAQYRSITYSDNNGYYELLLPKETELRVSVFNENKEYFTAEEVTIFAGLNAEIMGPFNEDTILENFVNNSKLTLNLSLSGHVFQCDGELSNNSLVSMTIADEDETYTFPYLNPSTDGTFLIEGNVNHFVAPAGGCISVPYTVTLVGNDMPNNMYSDSITFEITDSNFVQNEIELTSCNETPFEYSTAKMIVDGTDFYFTQIKTRKIFGDIIANDESSSSYGLFEIPNIQNGINSILNLELADSISGKYFKAVNEQVDMEIINLTSTSATAAIVTDFTDENNSVVIGTCIINLNF